MNVASVGEHDLWSVGKANRLQLLSEILRRFYGAAGHLNRAKNRPTDWYFRVGENVVWLHKAKNNKEVCILRILQATSSDRRNGNRTWGQEDAE